MSAFRPRSPRAARSSRRDFLGSAGALALGACLPGRLLATLPAEARSAALRPAPQRPSLVVVFLRGGNDALNTIIPWSDKTYHELRPSISIPAEATADEPGVLKLDERYGLHPAMAPLKPFWDRKLLAPILGVGSPHPTRSHFDAQDFMEYGAPGDRSVHSGWLNRYLQATRTKDATPLRALAMQGNLPRSLRGDEPVLAVPDLRAKDSEGLLDLFDDVYKSESGVGGEMMGGGAASGGEDAGRSEAVAVGRSTIETLRSFWDYVDRAPAGETAYPKSYVAGKLRTIARVIKNGAPCEIAAIDAGGWDHHQGEGSTDGNIQRELKTLCDSLAAFATDLGPALDRVTILVMTEFGRTAAENGNRGTDHGRGGMMLALGGRVAGGRVYGEYGSLETKHLVDGRDLQVTIDFRTVFAETLLALFDFQAPKGFFPLFTPKDPLGLLRKG